MVSILKKAMYYLGADPIKAEVLVVSKQCHNGYSPYFLQMPSTEKIIKVTNKSNTWIFTTFIDVDFNNTDEINIDFSTYPQLIFGICLTNFRCNKRHTQCDLSTYHFIKYIKVIGNNFLVDCNQLTTIKLSQLRKIRSIGSNFLYGCSWLTHIDLSSFSNVKTIGPNFLSNCHMLTEIELSSFGNVTTFGHSIFVPL